MSPEQHIPPQKINTHRNQKYGFSLCLQNLSEKSAANLDPLEDFFLFFAFVSQFSQKNFKKRSREFRTRYPCNFQFSVLSKTQDGAQDLANRRHNIYLAQGQCKTFSFPKSGRFWKILGALRPPVSDIKDCSLHAFWMAMHLGPDWPEGISSQVLAYCTW